MVTLRAYFLVSILFFPALIFSQNDEISGRKNELVKLKSEITDLETQLKSKTKKEKQSLESLQLYSKQNLFINKLINSIRSDESRKENEIKQTRKQIASIEKEMKNIRDLYSRYVVYLYKYGKTDKLNFLFNTNSFHKAMMRYKYLQRLTERNEQNLVDLDKAKNDLVLLNKSLLVELEEKRNLEEQKRAEERVLSEKIKERKELVKQLRNNKDALMKEIELKRKSESEIRNLIVKLIEEERRKAEERRMAEERKKAEELKLANELKKVVPNNKNTAEKTHIPDKEKTSKSDDLESDFNSSSFVKGKLLWPVDNGKIIRKFGENKNEKLNTITLNYGVDIKTAGGTSVKAVSGGIVSSVTWLPGYGSIIILTHKDNFRTVYGHLSEIYVSEGTQVLPGSVIGSVSEGLEGNILHFEIWSERVNQNPELWLVKK